jgi:hypothetical protein
MPAKAMAGAQTTNDGASKQECLQRHATHFSAERYWTLLLAKIALFFAKNYTVWAV